VVPIDFDCDDIVMNEKEKQGDASRAPRLSVVVPMYNEIENVAPFFNDVHKALEHYCGEWELVLVDDGSSDGTGEALRQEAISSGGHVRVISLQRNFGQTAAMQAGFDAARGEVIATLDGDLQNDPADIPRLVERLVAEDLDLIQGWRQKRKDDLIRKIPSRIANRLIGRITDVTLHDYGCSLKVYRASVIKGVRLFGDMHRFIPAWMSMYTSSSRITEEVVNHRARIHGESKYGLGRTFRVIIDLISVYFFLRFLSRPGHFFGRISMFFGGLGGLILGYLGVLKIGFGEDIGTRPLLLIGILFILVAVQLMTTGVLSELNSRTYFATGDTRSYTVRRDSGGGLADKPKDDD
jgi:glycosyltransferase involved in cell wall biosynthesis